MQDTGKTYSCDFNEELLLLHHRFAWFIALVSSDSWYNVELQKSKPNKLHPIKAHINSCQSQNLHEKLCVIRKNAISMVLNSTMAKQQVENRAFVHLGFVYTHRFPTHPYFEAASQDPEEKWRDGFLFFPSPKGISSSQHNYVQATSKIIILLQKKLAFVPHPSHIQYSVCFLLQDFHTFPQGVPLNFRRVSKQTFQHKEVLKFC